MRLTLVGVTSLTSGGYGPSVLFVLLLLGWAGAASGQERPGPAVLELSVEGNRRIQSAAILNRVQTKIGDSFSPRALRDDVRAIFALGFFDDVQVRTEEFEGGVRVIFVVVERPILREVSYEGNAELKTEDLREKAALRVGVLYNPDAIQRAEESIRQKYEEEGYFGVAISPRTERTPEGDLRVVFRIVEGRKIYIDRIVIEGNQALKASQIKDVMLTKERFLWILPFSTVHRKVFEEDAERILNLYSDFGYVQARIESHEIIPDLARGEVTLRTRVIEGPQFRVGSIALRGNQVISDATLRPLIKLKEGDVYNRSRVGEARRDIQDRYSEIGRALAEVNPEISLDPDKLLVTVAFAITEGSEVYVERINITGNTTSSEKVLRRELRVAEGDLFTNQKLVRSRQRLFNLGFFEEVTATFEPGSAPDKVVINIDVKERATGLFSVGAGYSSLDSVFGTLDVTKRNLFGVGQEVFLRIRIGAKSQLGLIGFTEPYLFDIPLRAGFDIYDRDRDFDHFTENRLGGDLRASYPLGEFTTLSGAYRIENVKVSDIPANAPDVLKKEQGKRLISAVDLTLSRDTRDNVFEPSSGSRNTLGVSFAGLGGDTQYYQVGVESAWFFPLPVLDLVFAARGSAGIIQGWGGKDVPISERFFLGGDTSLRGFRTRSVGPRDAASGFVLGGDKQILLTSELLIPIFPHFRLALFFDAGNAYGLGTAFDPTDLRLDAGAGVRFQSPLGPLRLDYGFNLDRRPGEKMGQINFSVGSPF